MPNINDRIKDASKLHTDYLTRITSRVYVFCRNQKIDREFDREIKKYDELVKVFPQQWTGTSRSEYCFWRLFSNTVLLKKFVKLMRDELMESDVRITNEFMTEPWEYTLFEVTKTEDSLVYAVDAVSGEEFLLYSPHVADLEQQGGKLFRSLLFYNGIGYQSYGIIQYFKGITAHDFEYFSSAIYPGVFAEGGIPAVMNRFPVPYMMFYGFCEIPFVVHKNEEIRYCASVNVIPGFEVDAVEGYDAKMESGDIVKFAYLIDRDPMRSGSLYVNRATGEVTLLTTTVAVYRELSKRLPFDFGPDPDTDAGLVMVSACEQISGNLFPGTAYDQLFSDDGELREDGEPSEDPAGGA